MDNLHFFTYEQGNFLARLLLAHIIADFVLQTKNMAEKKTWLSGYMLSHIAIVFAITFLLSASWGIALIITGTHWLIDGTKRAVLEKKHANTHTLFIVDQALHLIIIMILWAYNFDLFDACYRSIISLLNNYELSLLTLGYAIVIWPLGFLIKFALHKIIPKDNTENIENVGKLIGQYERIIILTFVLLGEYAAIGFLITGKSIIRFAQKDEPRMSEYVLVGTMMSYSLSILFGILLNWVIQMHPH